jgi:hypothetical protein
MKSSAQIDVGKMMDSSLFQRVGQDDGWRGG